MANPYMPLYVGDYLKDTGELTNEEHGVYLKLLMFMWSQGGFLKNDARVLARLTGVSYRRWAPIWANLERYFYVDGDTLRHTKVEKTLRKAREISELRKRAAAKKHAKKSSVNNETASANADGSRMQMHPIQSKGLDSSLREENPIPTAQSESSPQAASPPSPEGGGGDAPAAAEWVPLPASASALMEELRGLQRMGKISVGDLTQFRKAVQGERAGRVVLHPAYEPPAVISEIINRPFLKAIEGGKP